MNPLLKPSRTLNLRGLISCQKSFQKARIPPDFPLDIQSGWAYNIRYRAGTLAGAGLDPCGPYN